MSLFGEDRKVVIGPVDGNKGVGMVAGEAFKAQEIVVSEAPIFSARLSDAFASPAFLKRADVAKVVDALGEIEAAHGVEKSDGDYPAEAAVLVDELCHLHFLERFGQLDAAGAARVWALEDAFRDARPGDAVQIDGLVSDLGRRLNGRVGRAVEGPCDVGRVRVEVPGLDGSKAIRLANLKTARGIIRTNATREGDYGFHVFDRLSRLNHASGPHANVSKAFVTMPGGDRVCGIVTTRAVAEGAELLIDYGGPAQRGQSAAETRAWLKRHYNFDYDAPPP